MPNNSSNHVMVLNNVYCDILCGGMGEKWCDYHASNEDHILAFYLLPPACHVHSPLRACLLHITTADST